MVPDKEPDVNVSAVTVSLELANVFVPMLVDMFDTGAQKILSSAVFVV